MPATEPFCKLIGINPNDLSKEENILLEIDLFTQICEELKEEFRSQHTNYFRTMKFNKEMEDAMLEASYVRLIIQDILLTKEYDLPGLARYADTYEDVVQEVVTGRNISPSANFLRKIIELHKSVRQDLYNVIIKKIVTRYLAVA